MILGRVSRGLAALAAVIALVAWTALVTPVAARAASPSAKSAPTAAEQHLRVGLGAVKDGFVELGAKELRAFLELAPDHPRRAAVLDILVEIETNRENWEGARWALEQMAAETGETGLEAGFRLAQVAQREARWKEARDRFEVFLAEAPKRDLRRPEAWAGLTEALLELEDSGALRTAEKALTDSLLVTDGQAAERVAVAGAKAAIALSDPSARRRMWEAVVQWGRDPALRRRALYEQGRAQLEAGETDQGAQTLRTYLSDGAAKAHVGSAHLLLADQAFEAQQDGEGLDHLEAALATKADGYVNENRTALHKQALFAALRMEQLDRAVDHARTLSRALYELPEAEQAVVWLTLAQAEEKADRPLEAANAYLNVPEGAQRYRGARLAAARLLFDAGRPTETLEALAPLQGEPDPEGEVRLTALAAAEKAGDREAALRFIDALLAELPEGVEEQDLLLRKAGHEEALGRAEASTQTLQTAAVEEEVTPEVAEAAFSKMQKAFYDGDWKAVLTWAAAARVSAKPREARFYQAEALWELGRKGKAKSLYEELAQGRDNRSGGAAVRLGMLAEEGGDAKGALHWFQVALDRPTPDAAADYAYERVRALKAQER